MMYSAFGLVIESDVVLPVLLPSDSPKPDIHIVRGEVSQKGLENPVVIRPRGQSAPNQLWFEVPGVARFYVTNGNYIRYAPEEGSDSQSLQLYLLGSCMGAILHQRGRIVLHGNALRSGDSAIVFAGVSGQGKSTLAGAFYQRGYEVLADDLAVVDDNFDVHPAYPQLKVWHDAANKLGIEAANLNRIRHQIDKYAYPLDQGFCRQKLPVKAVYILNSHNEDRFEIRPVTGMQKFSALKQHTYRFGHLEGFGLMTQHLKLCAQLASQVDVFDIYRPNTGFRLDELVDLIERNLCREGVAA
ncbi:MAG: hypothetical protein ACI9Y1_001482 [Lentisphaeria bacterium]|jgi:hypothetical protein